MAPFRGGSAVETLHAILTDARPRLPRGEGISTELEHVVCHCLEKKPDVRFQSAKDLLLVLEKFRLRWLRAEPRRATRSHRFPEFAPGALVRANDRVCLSLINTGRAGDLEAWDNCRHVTKRPVDPD